MKYKVSALIEDNRKHYNVPGCASFQYRSKNGIFFGSGGLHHELAKCVGASMLNRWGDVKFDDKVLLYLTELTNAIESCMKDFVKEKADFITEAQSKEHKERIIDLVRLRDEVHFEFESNRKTCKEGSTTIYI